MTGDDRLGHSRTGHSRTGHSRFDRDRCLRVWALFQNVTFFQFRIVTPRRVPAPAIVGALNAVDVQAAFTALLATGVIDQIRHSLGVGDTQHHQYGMGDIARDHVDIADVH